MYTVDALVKIGCAKHVLKTDPQYIFHVDLPKPLPKYRELPYQEGADMWTIAASNKEEELSTPNDYLITAWFSKPYLDTLIEVMGECYVLSISGNINSVFKSVIPGVSLDAFIDTKYKNNKYFFHTSADKIRAEINRLKEMAIFL